MDHKTVAITRQCIKGPSAIKTTKNCHRKQAANGTTSGHSKEVAHGQFTGDTIESLMEFTNADLLKASRVLESRLAASRSQISALTSSAAPGSLDATRLASLRAEQKQTLKLCEGLYYLSLDEEEKQKLDNGQAARKQTQQLKKSVAFDVDDVKSANSGRGASPSFIRASLAELESRAVSAASVIPAEASAKPPQPSKSKSSKPKSRDDLDASVGGDSESVRRRYQELLRSRVKALWSDFDVAEARETPGGWHRRRSASLDGSFDGGAAKRSSVTKTNASQKPRAATSSMSLSRTIPEPFSMTLRDSAADPAALRKSRSLLQFEAELRRRRDEEEAACRIRFHASPVPAHVRMPLFEELSEQQRARRREIRELSRERLRQLEQPFHFTSTELERTRAESTARTEAAGSGQLNSTTSTFRANPVPPSSSAGEAVRARQQLREEDELLRQIRIRMRSEELLSRSAAPGEMALRQSQMEEAKRLRLAKHGLEDPADSVDGKTKSKSKQKQQQLQKLQKSKLKQRRQLAGQDPPDFKKLHWGFGQELLASTVAATAATGGRIATRTKPFRLRTEERGEQRKPATAGHQQQQQQQQLFVSAPSPMRSSTKVGPDVATRSKRTLIRHEEAPPARLTQSAMLREARRSAERQAEERRQREARSTAKQREVARRDLAESVRASVSMAAANSGPSVNELTRSRLESLRDQEESYKQQLRAMKEKMKQRDLLVVQQAKLIAQQRAQDKYRKTLEEAGLDPKQVDENAKRYQEGDLQSYTQDFEDDNRYDSPNLSLESDIFQRLVADIPASDEEVSDQGSGSGSVGGSGRQQLIATVTGHAISADD